MRPTDERVGQEYGRKGTSDMYRRQFLKLMGTSMLAGVTLGAEAIIRMANAGEFADYLKYDALGLADLVRRKEVQQLLELSDAIGQEDTELNRQRFLVSLSCLRPYHARHYSRRQRTGKPGMPRRATRQQGRPPRPPARIFDLSKGVGPCINPGYEKVLSGNPGGLRLVGGGVCRAGDHDQL